jgi:hypothetical protein
MKRIIESFLVSTEFQTFIRQKKTLMLLLIILLSLPAPGQVQLNDNAKISLLTASPWYGAVYAFFGHTAIRVQVDSTGVDLVFYYGYLIPHTPFYL